MMSAKMKKSAIQFECHWTIENFFLLNPCSISVTESPEFEIPTFPGTKWSMGCYPTGNLKENILLVFLKRSNDDGPQTVSVKFSVSAVYPKCISNMCHISTFSKGKIWTSTIKLHSLNNQLKLSLQYKFFSSEKENGIKLGEEKDIVNLSQDLKKLLANETHWDIVLRSYNQVMKAHRCVLWSRCPELLKTEHSRKHCDELRIEMQPHELKTLLEDIYTGKLDSLKSDKPLSAAAHKYELSLCKKLHTIPLSLSVQSHVQLFSVSYRMSIEKFNLMGLNEKVFSPLLYINANELSQWRIVACLNNNQGNEKLEIHIKSVSAEVSNSIYLHFKIELMNTRYDIPTAYSISSFHMFNVGEDYIVPMDIWKKQIQGGMEYFTNGTLSFKCELSTTNGNVSSSHKKLESKCVPSQLNNFKNLSNDLHKLYKNKDFSNVSLIIGDIKFPAHKAILAARSPVFSRMFQANMTESITNQVEIKDIEPDTVSLLLEYIYVGKVTVPNIASVMQLYVAADKYEVLTLKQNCSSYLQSHLNNENVCKMLILADTHNDGVFKTTAQSFIYFNADTVLVMDEWKNLIEIRIDLAAEILQHLSVYYAKKKKFEKTNPLFLDRVPASSSSFLSKKRKFQCPLKLLSPPRPRRRSPSFSPLSPMYCLTSPSYCTSPTSPSYCAESPASSSYSGESPTTPSHCAESLVSPSCYEESPTSP